MDLGGEEAEDGQRQKDEQTEDGRRRAGLVAVEKKDDQLTDAMAARQSTLKYDLATTSSVVVVVVVVVVRQLADPRWTAPYNANADKVYCWIQARSQGAGVGAVGWTPGAKTSLSRRLFER